MRNVNGVLFSAGHLMKRNMRVLSASLNVTINHNYGYDERLAWKYYCKIYFRESFYYYYYHFYFIVSILDESVITQIWSSW